MNKAGLHTIEYGEQGERGVSLGVAAMRVTYDKQENLKKYRQFVQVAKEKGVDLLVLPEMSLQGYLWSQESSWGLPPETARYHWQEAESVPGPSCKILCQMAKEFSMHLAFGLVRRSFHGGSGVEHLYNSAVLVGPEGIVGVYDKIHTPSEEKHIFRSGRHMKVFQTPLGKIGIMICWDVAFPEQSRILTLRGADILLLPTTWMVGPTVNLKGRQVEAFGHLAYQYFIRTRALENHVWFLSANWVGLDTKSGLNFLGGSAIINPLGLVLAEISHQEGLAIAHGLDIAGERVLSKTELLFGNNLFLDRRPELYSPLSECD